MNSWKSINDIMRRIVRSCGLPEAEFDDRTLEVDGGFVAYLEVIPRKSRDGEWVGVNVSTITLQGTSATLKSFFFPGRKAWTRCSDSEIEELIANTNAFLLGYASRCADSA